MDKLNLSQRFALGKIVITQAVKSTIDLDDVREGLGKHASCNWGLATVKQWGRNDSNVQWGRGKLLSIYCSRRGDHFWVCTNEALTQTTVSLAKNYLPTKPKPRLKQPKSKPKPKKNPNSKPKSLSFRPFGNSRWIERKNQNVAWLMWFLFGVLFANVLWLASGASQ